MADCSIKQRSMLIHKGLKDRDAAVRNMALKVLTNWFTRDCANDTTALLQHLDVEEYTGDCDCCQFKVCAITSL